MWLTNSKSPAFVLFLSLAFSLSAQIPGRQVLAQLRPARIGGLNPAGDLPATNRLTLAIGLPLRHQDQLTQLLRDLSDPSSPRYRQFLKPREFADQFAPSEADYQALIGFARARRFRVLKTHSNRLLLEVSASAAEVNEAFHVKMKTYRHPTEGRIFYAPDAAPSVDFNIPILRVSGLDDFVLPKPAMWTTSAAVPQSGSGPGGGYLGNDFRAAYVPGVALTGAGQSVALVEFDSYHTNDILNYESLCGIAPVAITNVLFDGVQVPLGSGQEEVDADIDMVVGMAPGLSRVMVYEANYVSVSTSDALLNQIAEDDAANQISCSWLFEIDTATDQIFQEMDAQGQSYLNASGDFGAFYGANMPTKEGDPFITVVGGSVLTTTGPGGAWQSEQAWSSGGGGVSGTYPIPYWQQAVNMTTNRGSALWRNTPDVAMQVTGIVVYDNGNTNPLTGTSLSAPLWAAFTALVNQQAAQNGKPPVGFLNPALYGIGQGGLYAGCFHDIVTGGNGATNYRAVKGFDLCAGWGTPTGSNLINALAPPDSLLLLPSGGLSFSLTNNSANRGETQTLLLTNTGSSPISWAIGTVPSWLQFSATNGTAPAGAAVTLTATTTAGATNLLAGGYGVDLALTNLTAAVPHAIPVFLAVSDPLILTPSGGFAVSGPAGGPFNANSQVISLSNAATTSISWTVNSTSAFLNAAPGSGTLLAGQIATVTATLSPAASNLLINAAGGGLAFADLATGITRTLPFTLAVGNGGFETGDFSDWTFTGDTNDNLVGDTTYYPYVHSGNFAAVMGEPTNLATLSQSVPTAPGRLCLLSFWLDNPVGGNPNEFKAVWNGATLFVQTNMPKFSWTNMQFPVTASGPSSTVEFLFQNKPDAFGFDDVSVTPIVAPAFASVVVSNGSLLFNWSAMAGFSYQLQSTTNLAAPAWTNIGSLLLASNGMVTAKAAAPTNPPTFFRAVMPLP